MPRSPALVLQQLCLSSVIKTVKINLEMEINYITVNFDT